MLDGVIFEWQTAIATDNGPIGEPKDAKFAKKIADSVAFCVTLVLLVRTYESTSEVGNTGRASGPHEPPALQSNEKAESLNVEFMPSSWEKLAQFWEKYSFLGTVL